MALAHTERASSSQVARFSKRFFETSFGPKVEYLLIPKLSDKLHEVCVPTELDKTARTLIFFNGWILRLSQWGTQTPAYTIPRGMAGFEDYNIILLDNLGHGKSEMGANTRPENYLGLCAVAAKELVEHLGADHVFTVGHSMGGAISLEFAQMYDKIDGMIFISPVLKSPLELLPNRSPLAALLPSIRSFLTGPQASENVDRLLTMLSSDLLIVPLYAYYRLFTSSKITREQFSKMIRKSLEMNVDVVVTAFDAMVKTGNQIGLELPDIHVPVKIIMGDKDFIISPRKERKVLEAMAPFADFNVIHGAAHWANSERPKTVNRLMLEFLNQCGEHSGAWRHDQ